jgi:threonine dehydrogenase-like Zn-dependent dehydrogenase
MKEMREGDIIGHEPMGEVVEVGSGITKFQKGDRVVVPAIISCGHCWFCDHQLYAHCDNTNPDAEKVSLIMGQAPGGRYGHGHLMGGYPGGQAEYMRVPNADAGPMKVPDNLTDDQALFLSDIFPTGYMAAENADIQAGDTVAIWGCGPVGQFVIQSAWMLGAARVIAIDLVPERLEMARTKGRAEVIDTSKQNVYDTLMEMTGGRGPDRAIDAVGTEAHAVGGLMEKAIHGIDRAKQALNLEQDRPQVLREAIKCVRKGGTVSVPGAYMGMVDTFPMGTVMNKGLTIRSDTTHMQRYMTPLLEKIEQGEIDPTFVITHTASLDEAPAMYEKFRNKEDGCIKVVLKPHA